MNHLLSTTSLSTSEIKDILRDAHQFSKGDSGNQISKCLFPIYFMNQAQERKPALKWLKESLDRSYSI